MAVNEHAAIYDWLSTCPLLTDALIFDFLSERQGSVTVSPVASAAWVKQYVRGAGIRQYEFAVQVMLMGSDSTDTTNSDNMYLQDTWREWIEQQERDKNFPDFGENCSDYALEVLGNMPQLAQRYESGFCKYQFFARLKYFTKGE